MPESWGVQGTPALGSGAGATQTPAGLEPCPWRKPGPGRGLLPSAPRVLEL